MTIRFKRYWNGIHPGSTATFSERTEARLIGQGLAVRVDDINTFAGANFGVVPLTPEEQADAQARITEALARYV